MASNKISIQLDSNLYSKEAIFKCIYWYSDRFLVDVNLISNKYNIEYTPKAGFIIEPNELPKLKEKIIQDLNDYNLRDIISKETKDIRNLLIAKAFSPFDTEEFPP